MESQTIETWNQNIVIVNLHFDCFFKLSKLSYILAPSVSLYPPCLAAPDYIILLIITKLVDIIKIVSKQQPYQIRPLLVSAQQRVAIATIATIITPPLTGHRTSVTALARVL